MHQPLVCLALSLAIASPCSSVTPQYRSIRLETPLLSSSVSITITMRSPVDPDDMMLECESLVACLLNQRYIC
ncbi:uncharacterized protein F5891DRAFT_1033097 [Suillus fuscotomentosus]|uniref:Secreted protein n=1 Tax=Suillus fuscotomentosus TaxID=1912939 RepID=A0AAD4E6U2_9AGAM|nr:uncharacterized protein F5891DRAFT_1033097 [Suillus fuscotomentosus]KAG1900652.1 hypothetical protein F5891DRAFT_1033097 [Suillus fuscotomentosus]